jgi:hypothetical protein
LLTEHPIELFHYFVFFCSLRYRTCCPFWAQHIIKIHYFTLKEITFGGSQFQYMCVCVCACACVLLTVWEHILPILVGSEVHYLTYMRVLLVVESGHKMGNHEFNFWLVGWWIFFGPPKPTICGFIRHKNYSPICKRKG